MYFFPTFLPLPSKSEVTETPILVGKSGDEQNKLQKPTIWKMKVGKYYLEHSDYSAKRYSDQNQALGSVYLHMNLWTLNIESLLELILVVYTSCRLCS